VPAVDPSTRAGVSPGENPFVHAAGKVLVDDQGRKLVPRGLAITNEVWTRRTVPAELPAEEDYRRSAELGANAIRFYLSYRWFEDDAKPYTYDERGFAWLSRNLAWAKAHGIRLLLNLHVPQGGFQSAGEGRALWNDPENQRRFVALWREIARRYRDEPAVLGYDLLNEPVVKRSIVQWEELARSTVAAIRAEDPRHLIAIERVNGVYPGGFLRASASPTGIRTATAT
jgi:endoglucanase